MTDVGALIDTLARGDELSLHRAIRTLVREAEVNPVDVADRSEALEAVLPICPTAQRYLLGHFDELPMPLGVALLAVATPPPIDVALALKRWYDAATHISDAGPYADVARRAVERGGERITEGGARLSEAERKILEREVGALAMIISRDSGVAMKPPPETPAQREMRLGLSHLSSS